METIDYQIKGFGRTNKDITVSLSNELVQLLSDQLYSSPLKAIEELVVNSYDAEAENCVVYVPNLNDGLFLDKRVMVYDDGHGMDVEGLEDLWKIGRSNKVNSRNDNLKSRKLIGKFGIGKLATYAISNKITYISKSEPNKINSVSLDYREFKSNPTGVGEPIKLPLFQINDEADFYRSSLVIKIAENLALDVERDFKAKSSWTVVVLEDLKKKTLELQLGKLKWVLATAMPITNEFHLYIGSEPILSSKSSIPKVAEFSIKDIPEDRIENLRKKSGLDWQVEGDSLVSSLFEEGISAEVMLTEKPINEGKSTDLSRSNGFFVKVRGRLVNLVEKSFGLSLSSAETYARFRAEIFADDLDRVITAPREGVETSELKDRFQEALEVIYLHARQLYEEFKNKENSEFKRNKEGSRQHIFPELVEKPIADVISIYNSQEEGTEADDTWFYFKKPDAEKSKKIAIDLYETPRKKYKYNYQGFGRSGRMVKYDPLQSEFNINSDHDLVAAHFDNARSRTLLEDILTAETLLEVYLREQNLNPIVIGEILEKRDKLFRGLAKDHKYSPLIISADIKDSSSIDLDLEINLVIAMRALGFQAIHKAGASEPDGIARFTNVNNEELVLTLEAKSSKHIPQLSQLDFAGLQEHMKKHDADGCLLLAPSYPGESRENQSSTANRAQELGISCWTIDTFCKILEARDRRHITAEDVYKIVIKNFSPVDVENAVNELLSGPSWEVRKLYLKIIETLKKLDKKLKGAPRNISQVAALISVSDDEEFDNINIENVREAFKEIAGSSKGALIVKDEIIQLNTSLEDLERRISDLTGNPGLPFEKSNFKK